MTEWLIKKGVFRNANHGVWFANSFFTFIFAVLVHLDIFGKLIFLVPLAVHLLAVIFAVRVVYLVKQKSELLSIDCIWFNILMVVCYIVLMCTF